MYIPSKTKGIPALPKNLRSLANSLALPWRDAGARDKKRVKVAPHECRRTIVKTKIHGESVTVEYRK